MVVIGYVLLVILVISAILLVLLVLVQDDQGEGIGGIFGGGSNTAFGSRSGNVLTRFTAVLATIFLVCVFGVAWVNRTPTEGNVITKARQQALTASDEKPWYEPTSSTSQPSGGSGASDTAAANTSGAGASTTTPSEPASPSGGGQ